MNILILTSQIYLLNFSVTVTSKLVKPFFKKLVSSAFIFVTATRRLLIKMLFQDLIQHLISLNKSLDPSEGFQGGISGKEPACQ